jgi:tetraacyldisaccharide 4'-kinase
MTFTTPKFWYANKGLLSLLLWPLSLLYLLVIKIRSIIIRPIKPSIKVICVGNATVGGAGKTPICLFIAEILQQKNIAFLSRGYKVSRRSPKSRS